MTRRARANESRSEAFRSGSRAPAVPCGTCPPEREFFIDNLLVRIYFIIVMIRWIGLAPWEFEFPFPGGLTSTYRRYEWLQRHAKSETQIIQGRNEILLTKIPQT